MGDRTLERLAAAAGRQPLLGQIHATAGERREVMLAYLAQEGLATNGRVSGLVDVGWMGRTFQSLNTAMEQTALPPIHSFFYIGRSSWGLGAGPLPSSPRVSAHGCSARRCRADAPLSPAA